MARTNNKNNERKTTINGIWANAKTQEFNQFSVVTEYTRSTEKAVKLASAIINPDNDPAIMVSVSELVQEKKASKYFDNSALYLESDLMAFDENEARENCKDGQTVVKGTVYSYHTNVFYYDIKTGKYNAEPFYWSYGANVTAKDCRAMLAIRFEEMNENCKVIALDEWGTTKGYEKYQSTVWYVIDDEKLERCIKEENDER